MTFELEPEEREREERRLSAALTRLLAEFRMLPVDSRCAALGACAHEEWEKRSPADEYRYQSELLRAQYACGPVVFSKEQLEQFAAIETEEQA